MPELPEVETIARQLDGVIVDKKIEEVAVMGNKSFYGDREWLVGKKITKVDRHAKMIVWHLDDKDKVVMIHLKMTGQLVWRPKDGEQVAGGHPSEDWNARLPNQHTRVEFDLEDESKLFFNDMRMFGWVKVVNPEELKALKDRLPPDVVDDSFTLEYFRNVLARSGRSIKVMLMDQQKIGGIGNIYDNDALNLARIHPKRSAKSLSEDETKALHEAIKVVINKGIEMGGATYSDYKDSRGQGGRYQEHFLTYGREGEKCKNCGGVIVKINLGGRGTYFCESCQI